VFPQPHIVRLIQDKRLQKQFYQENSIPTAPFFLIDQKNDLKKYADFLPAVQKLGREGYDGRGVKVMHTVADLAQGFEQPSLLEKKVDILKEISVIVARNQQGDVKHFPPVEVVYHTEKNLVDYLLSPAQLPEKIAQKAVEIAYKVIEKLGMVGILAVEMFWDKQNQVLVNEIAPRPHNSGHQTIEANLTSQYEQHLRSILNLPLGNTAIRSLSAMINLLGENGHEGNARYLGLEKVLEMDGVYVHLYGKKTTKPYRKMGHITVLATNTDELNTKIQHIKHLVKVVAQ
ncbi:MAG: ATP-grasp domain-containing protein, partial [Flammeovirgaceae bacterium]|nr:ATP-grasp domain-containing protein [Flammeovirgaceae bacterium]MDW8288334.1 ATP-grasp domain-containing protein [Flammeovirgaceae bacterium]